MTTPEHEKEIDLEAARLSQQAARLRWVEVAISIFASAAVSALAVTWSLSATLAQFREQLNDHTRRIGYVEMQYPTAAGDIASLKARQDGDDRSRVELDARLQRIEAKLDAVLEGR